MGKSKIGVENKIEIRKLKTEDDTELEMGKSKNEIEMRRRETETEKSIETGKSKIEIEIRRLTGKTKIEIELRRLETKEEKSFRIEFAKNQIMLMAKIYYRLKLPNRNLEGLEFDCHFLIPQLANWRSCRFLYFFDSFFFFYLRENEKRKKFSNAKINSLVMQYDR